MRSAERRNLRLVGLALVLAVPIFWRAAATQPEQSEPADRFRLSELDDAVRVWRSTGKTPPGLPIDLAGFNFLWQASPGDGSRIAAVSKVHGGYLALFNEGGLLLDLRETGEIYYSILLCDLDQDAVAEVITDEVKGFGTGYLDRDLHVYKRMSDALLELGTRTSYRSRMIYAAGEEPRREITLGYVRCDPGDGMRRKGLAYVVERFVEGETPHVISRSQLHAEGGKLTERAE